MGSDDRSPRTARIARFLDPGEVVCAEACDDVRVDRDLHADRGAERRVRRDVAAYLVDSTPSGWRGIRRPLVSLVGPLVAGWAGQSSATANLTS
jgi:hypothetical protein